MSGAAPSRLGGGGRRTDRSDRGGQTVTFTLGVDLACRAPHQASLAAADGRVIWSGHRFRTSTADLEQLWARLPDAARSAPLRVVMEPTRNAWVALASWFRRHGATVVLVPPERSVASASVELQVIDLELDGVRRVGGLTQCGPGG